MDALFVVQGADQGKRFILKESVVTIGRDHSNSIALRDPEISPRHAEISKGEAGRCLLVDLESKAGVLVNGRRIHSWRLSSGDLIQFGQTYLLFTSNVPDARLSEPLVDISSDDSIPPTSKFIYELSQDDSLTMESENERDDETSTWSEKARANFNFMYEASIATSRTLDVDQLLERIQELAFQWAPIDRMSIFLYDADARKLVSRSSRSRNANERVKVSEKALYYAFQNQKGILASVVSTDGTSAAREAICVPMQGRYGLVGVVYIDVSLPSSGYCKLNEETLQHDNLQIQIDAKDDDQLIRYSTDDAVRQETPEPETISLSASFFNTATNVDDNSPKSSPSNASKKLTLDHLKLMMAIGRQAALAIEDTRYYLGMAQAERLAAIGQTVAALSHHIKNILQGIRGGSYLIHSGLKEHDEALVGKGWNIVEKNQARISDLVLDMLAFSKERAPVRSLADIGAVLTDVVELMRGRAHELNVDLVFFPNQSTPPFFFDKEQIHRAITNLVVNAIEASKDYKPALSKNSVKYPRGRVEISTQFDKERRRARVLVDDVGCGAPDELRDGFFRPFHTKNKSGGTGLGLAVTHKIVQEHKGKIIVEDSPLGGARFVLELPVNADCDNDDV